MKNRKTILWAAGIFFAGAILMTFASFRTYRNALPEVTLGEQRTGTVTREYRAQAEAGYHRITYYSVPAPVTVREVFVREGDLVICGDALLRVDVEALLEEKYRLELELEAQRDRLDKAEGTEALLLEHQLAGMEASAGAIETVLDADGIVVSTETGVVTEVYAGENVSLSPKAPLAATAGRSGGNLYLAWSFPNDTAALFDRGAGVETELFDNLAVTKKSGRNYICDVEDGTAAVLLPGETAEVCLTYKSQRYDHLIPLGAVTFLEDGKGRVFYTRERKTSFGVETYVTEANFTVLDYDGINVAADAAPGMDPRNPVVVDTTKPLSDGMAVREEITE